MATENTDDRKIEAEYRYGDRVIKPGNAADVKYLQDAAPVGDLNALKEACVISGDWTPKEEASAPAAGVHSTTSGAPAAAADSKGSSATDAKASQSSSGPAKV